MSRRISLSPATAGSGVSNNCNRKSVWHCSNPLRLGCDNHRHSIEVRCGRWRTCAGCAAWKRWTLTQRLMAGIEGTPDGLLPMFVTLTFPRADAPDEDGAHKALRSLVARLRYRKQLGAYSWVLERQSNGDPDGQSQEQRLGSLHYHGIWQMPWQDDDLHQWRSLITESGFGPRNRLTVASRRNAYYCTKYIAKGPADLAPLRRAYGFSRDFPRTEYEQERALSVIRPTPVRRERRDPLADPPSAPATDPGDQMSVLHFDELEIEMAQGLGVVRDSDACTWLALPGR